MSEAPGWSGPVVRASRLTRTFGQLTAVDGLDLEVAAGEIRALVGLNGAGKSTLLRLVVGLLRPDAGTAELWGRPAWQAPATIRTRLGYVSGAQLYPELTVTEHLRWAARLHGCSRLDANRRADHQIDRFTLGPWASMRTRTLSSGNRQRLALAAALVHDPDLVILDEPSNALDPAGIIDLRRLLAEQAQGGAAVLVSSHHLDEVARLASTISVMHDGRIVGQLCPHGSDLERQFFQTVAAAAGAQDER